MPVNILVADDSVTMRRIMELTFSGEDSSVTSVDNGEAAVNKAAEIQPDVVFADVSMSMDGYAVATAIKSSPGLENTAVILMASQKHPYDEARGSSSGVDDHILKPFDTQHVIDRLHQVLGQPRATVSAEAARAAAPAAAPVMPQRMAERGARTGTIAFGGQAPMAAPVAQPAAVAPRPAPVASRAAAPAVAAAAGDAASRIAGAGLDRSEVEAIIRDTVERVVWEVVPELAETLIKEEIRRLTG